jgi:DnaJ-class molecular chaperone
MPDELGELRASKVEDAPEELAEVEEARSVLIDPGRRASYDATVQAAEAEEAKKDAELDAYLQRSGRRIATAALAVCWERFWIC